MAEQEVSCAYCLMDLKSMTDPRELPCGDVFCLLCLKESGAGVARHQCVSCSRVFEDLDLNSLPSAASVTSEPGAAGTTAREIAVKAAGLKCDRCAVEPAVGYCIDCGEKSCARHMEFHDGYFDGQHEKVDILKYVQSPHQYNKAMKCVRHKKEAITMACKACYLYNCLQCDNQENSMCGGLGQQHIFLPFKTIESDLRSHFAEHLRRTDAKLTKIGEIEKKAWRRMDQLEKDCERMIADVEKKSKEQIDVIREQTEKLKKEITEYQSEKTEQVIAFVEELMKKKDTVEDVKLSTHRFLQDVHVTELIKQKQEKTNLLTTTNNAPLGDCDWTDKTLRIGQKRMMEIELRNGNALPANRTNETSFFSIYDHQPNWEP